MHACMHACMYTLHTHVIHTHMHTNTHPDINPYTHPYRHTCALYRSSSLSPLVSATADWLPVGCTQHTPGNSDAPTSLASTAPAVPVTPALASPQPHSGGDTSVSEAAAPTGALACQSRERDDGDTSVPVAVTPALACQGREGEAWPAAHSQRPASVCEQAPAHAEPHTRSGGDTSVATHPRSGGHASAAGAAGDASPVTRTRRALTSFSSAVLGAGPNPTNQGHHGAGGGGGGGGEGGVLELRARHQEVTVVTERLHLRAEGGEGGRVGPAGVPEDGGGGEAVGGGQRSWSEACEQAAAAAAPGTEVSPLVCMSVSVCRSVRRPSELLQYTRDTHARARAHTHTGVSESARSGAAATPHGL